MRARPRDPRPWAAGERVLVCVSEDPRSAGLVRTRQAPRRPAAGAVHGADHREPAQRSSRRGRARPHRRHAPARRAAGGRDRHPAEPGPHRRRRGGLRPRAQRHPRGDRQVDPLALVRARQRLGGPRPPAPLRPDQRPRRGRRGGGRRAGRPQGRAHRSPAAARPPALSRGARHGGGRPGARPRAAIVARPREHRPRLPHRRGGGGGAVRAVSVARRGPGLVARLQLLLLPPLYTFTIADPTNVVALFFFTLVAVVVSNLAGRVRAEATISGRARGRRRRSTASRASSRAAAPSTTCSGPPPTRSP